VIAHSRGGGRNLLVGKDPDVPHGYTKIDVDLNKGAQGKYIYAAFTREAHVGGLSRNPILGLDVIVADKPREGDNDEEQQPDHMWVTVMQDLNEGAKGKYVHLRCKFPRSDSFRDALTELEKHGDIKG
jgi:hypothetical protein